MAMLGKLLNRFKKSPPVEENDFDEMDDLPSMHHQAQARNSNNKSKQPDDEDEHENSGLPSVNRRSSSTVNIIGLGVILLIGLIAMFSVGNQSSFKPKTEQRKAEISSNLPPLELPTPAPPAPVPLKPKSTVPVISNSNLIPLQDKPPAVLDWSDRKLIGSMLVDNKQSDSNALTKAAEALNNTSKAITDAKTEAAPSSESNIAQIINALKDKSEAPKEDLEEKLKPTITKGVAAELLPNRNFVIAKGTALDCALETALDTTVPGLLTCRLTRDVYSDNGHVVMLDRGSQLVGEYKSGIKDGQARVFVLWTRAKTPNGVVIALDSPGTDALGRAGIEGWVDHHYAERFGAAILTSIIKDVFASIAYTAANRSNGNTQISIGNTSKESESIGVEILKRTAGTPPTLYVNQGAHIQVMVARDLDFSSVYNLELKK